MYIPKPFRISNENEIKTFIKHNSFGILFSQLDNLPQATHLPFILEEKGDSLYLVGHFAKGNPHWKSIDQKEVLIVFPGPHTYVSASWYEEKGTVPTWNYLAVHAYGVCNIINQQSELIELLQKTASFYEEPLQHAWKTEENMDAVLSMIRGIVGIRMKIDRLEGKAKLNQNHSVQRQEKVVKALESSYDLYDSKEIARKMRMNIEGK